MDEPDPRQQLLTLATTILESNMSISAPAGTLDPQATTLAKALSDPTRVSVLGLLTAGPRTAKQTATALGQEPARISYHVKQLAKAGLVEPDHTEITVNGIVTKYYRLSAQGRRVLRLDDPVPVAGAVYADLQHAVIGRR